jgi:hypothetical protein
MGRIALREHSQKRRADAPWAPGNAQAVSERRATRATSNGAIRRRKKGSAIDRENARIAKRLTSIRGGKRRGKGGKRGGGRGRGRGAAGSGMRAARAARAAAGGYGMDDSLKQPEWET